MNATIRGLKGLLALGALAGLGLLLRWVTAGSIEAATTQDLTSMATLAIGAVAWVAYCWLVLAVLATVLEQVPGAVGRTASLVASHITSQGSRALLRSALGVAAVTPLTIGVAHATPSNGHTITTQQAATTTGAHPWTSVDPRSTIEIRGTTPTSARPWNSLEPRSTIEVRSSTPTASGGSGSAGAQSTHPQTTGTPTGARPWNAVEPRSTIEVRGGTPTVSGGSGSAGAQSTHPQTTGTPAGARPWSSVEPRSIFEVTDGSPSDWRATEPQSSIQLTAPGTAKPPATPSQADTGRTTQPSPQPGTQSGTRPNTQSSDQSGTKAGTQAPTDQTQQRTQPATRSGAAFGKQTPTGRNAVPGRTGHATTGRTSVPEKSGHAATGRTGAPATGPIGVPATGRTGVPPTGRTGVPAKGPVGEVAVPDRPTSGAPTRYTHLQTGQLARAASHVVKPGDSLWSIAAAELGPDATDDTIAGRWPQWYAANRQLIGPDPNLILPGQVLNPPAPSQPVPPTHQEK
jgi:hypothetical protein